MNTHRILAYLTAAILGIAIGGYSALSMTGMLPAKGRITGPIEVDGWHGDFTVGSEDASPYYRARVARHGLLGLANTEAIYFNRLLDDSGEPFRENCTYRISGGAMPARWWSVTLYNQESFLPDNTDAALSFDASRAASSGDEAKWSAIIAPEKPADGGGWISSRAAGEFDLTLRLYVPDEGVLDQPAQMITAPSVERLGCKTDAP